MDDFARTTRYLWLARPDIGCIGISRIKLRMSTYNREPVTLEDAKNAVGTEIGVSPWRVVSQEMINQFADATDDHQFIHVDPERAATETPFGGTIAHGFLTLSLLSTLAYEALPMLEGATMGINYGFDKIGRASCRERV